MLQVVAQLSNGLIKQMTDHLNTLAGNLQPDVSNYAKGRQRFWIEHEAPLTQTQNFKPGVHDERLWSWIHRTFPDMELGLAAYGATGISLHRDAWYADFMGYSINLGNIEGWEYHHVYPEYKWVPGHQLLPGHGDCVRGRCNAGVVYSLKPGDIVKFNVKNPHGVINPAPDRWSINLWRISDKARPAFKKYLQT